MDIQERNKREKISMATNHGFRKKVISGKNTGETKITEIARKAEVSIGALYLYFKIRTNCLLQLR